MPLENQQDTSPMNSSIFIPIDLEASLGRIEYSNERKRKASTLEQATTVPASKENGTVLNMTFCGCMCCANCSDAGRTRTSSRTPFGTEPENDTKQRDKGNSQLLKPYPMSETDVEIRERKRLNDSVDWSNGIVVNSPPTTSINDSANADQESMMEVTVDDFVLSAEEARSVTDLDATTIQDDDFWETPVQVATNLSMNPADVQMMSSVPFSVTFSSQDPIEDIDNDDELTDAAPIRSVDMEW